MAGRRKSDDAYDNFGMQYEGWLDGHRVWPCMNPKCSNKVDPDALDQYCSKSCFNAVQTNPGATHAQKAFFAVAQQAAWVKKARASGFISSPDSAFQAQRADHGALAQQVDATLNRVRRLQIPVRR